MLVPPQKQSGNLHKCSLHLIALENGSGVLYNGIGLDAICRFLAIRVKLAPPEFPVIVEFGFVGLIR